MCNNRKCSLRFGPRQKLCSYCGKYSKMSMLMLIKLQFYLMMVTQKCWYNESDKNGFYEIVYKWGQNKVSLLSSVPIKRLELCLQCLMFHDLMRREVIKFETIHSFNLKMNVIYNSIMFGEKCRKSLPNFAPFSWFALFSSSSSSSSRLMQVQQRRVRRSLKRAKPPLSSFVRLHLSLDSSVAQKAAIC